MHLLRKRKFILKQIRSEQLSFIKGVEKNKETTILRRKLLSLKTPRHSKCCRPFTLDYLPKHFKWVEVTPEWVSPWVLEYKRLYLKNETNWLLQLPFVINSVRLYQSTGPYRFVSDSTYKRFLYTSYIEHRLLVLNFYKKGFFPALRTISGHTYACSSLGMFSKFFNKGKNFTRTKTSFLASASYLRKVLLYTSIVDLILIVKRIPLYFADIMNTIHNPGIPFYNHPFQSTHIVDEMLITNNFRFRMFMFFNNKNYGEHKTKTRGRLKRKISRRLFRLNNILD